MMPATGPKISSRITGMEWSTSSSTCGARYGEPARLAGNCASSITGLARRRRSKPRSAARIVSAAAVRTTGPSVVASFERIAEHVLAREIDEAIDERVVQALVHVDALQAATGLTAVEVRAVDDVLDRVREIRVVAHVDRIAAAELEAGADEALRRRALHGMAACDRAGERDEVDARIANRTLRVRVTHVQRLKDAVRQTRLAAGTVAKRSAHSGVCAECLSTTALPAISAGTTLFTAMRYG